MALARYFICNKENGLSRILRKADLVILFFTTLRLCTVPLVLTVMGRRKRTQTRQSSVMIRSSIDRQFSPTGSNQTQAGDTNSHENSDGGDTDESGPPASPPAKRPRTGTCSTSTTASEGTPGKCSCALPSTMLIFFRSAASDPFKEAHIHGPCLFGRRDEKSTIKTSRQVIHPSIRYMRTLGYDASTTTFQDRQRSTTTTTGLHTLRHLLHHTSHCSQARDAT